MGGISLLINSKYSRPQGSGIEPEEVPTVDVKSWWNLKFIGLKNKRWIMFSL